MATFIIRIELHEPKAGDYERLHDKMKNEGADRTIIGDKQIEYHLPNGTYQIESTLTAIALCNNVATTVKTIDLNCSVLVIEVENMSWTGLSRV